MKLTTLKHKVRKLVWLILGKCEYCGGKLWYWDDKKAYCRECNKLQ